MRNLNNRRLGARGNDAGEAAGVLGIEMYDHHECHPILAGNAAKKSCNAAIPPAEAPMFATGTRARIPAATYSPSRFAICCLPASGCVQWLWEYELETYLSSRS